MSNPLPPDEQEGRYSVDRIPEGEQQLPAKNPKRRSLLQIMFPEQDGDKGLYGDTPAGSVFGHIARPIGKATENLASTVVTAGAYVANKAGWGRVDPDFQSWYDNVPDREKNPLQFGKWAEEMYGDKPKGVAGFGEDLTQFALGMVASTRALQAAGSLPKVAQTGEVISKALGISKVVPLAGSVAKAEQAGFLADFAFMDPYENNLLGVVDKAPGSAQNAITRALAADKDSPETWQRLKVGLQGFVIGRTLGYVTNAVRSVWLWRQAKALPVGSVERAAVEQKLVESLDPQPVLTVERPEVFQVQKDAADGLFKITKDGKAVAESPAFKRGSDAEALASSLNDFAPKASNDLLNLTKQIKDRILSGVSPADSRGLVDGTAFNFHWVSSPENARAWINAAAEAAGEAVQNKPKSLLESGALAQEMFGGSTPTEALGIAQEFLGKTENLDAYVQGLRAYQHAVAGYVSQLSERVDLGGPSAALDAEKLRVALGTLFELNPRLKEGGGNIARGLNAFKGQAPVDAIQFAEQAADQATREVSAKAPASAGVFAGLSKQEVKAVARHLRLADGDPTVIDAYLKNALGVTPPKKGTTAWDVFQSVRYSALLSGPMTHMKNTVSNFGMYIGRNLELASYGLQSGNKEMYHQGIDQLTSLWLDSMESFSVAMRSLKSGTSVLDAGIDTNKEGVAQLIETLTGGSTVAGPSSWLKRLYNAPSSFLMAEDEFFKQLNYRASVRAQAVADARRLFPNNPEKWAGHIKSTLDNAFTPTGAGINETALRMARENTFTQPLEGNWKAASEFIGKSKFLSFFFPFRNVPINVFLVAAERTPALWRVSTRMRADLAGMNGTEATAEAMSKLEMGQNLWLLATGLAAAGHLTGGGPKDGKARKQLEATGWLPYSFKTDDGRYVSYRAVEPFSTLMGIAADATEMAEDLSREGRDQDMTELVGAFMMGAAANVYNKSFLRGMSDMSDLFSGQLNSGERIMSGLASQLVPYSAFMSQTNPDDLMRDATTVMDRVKARVPYFSKGVEPVRSILGKPLPKQSWTERTVWPFTVSNAEDTEEARLMGDLLRGLGPGVRIPMPAARIDGGLVDLKDRDKWGKKQSPYDRMLELFGEGMKVKHGSLPPISVTLRAVVDEDKKKLTEIFGFSGYKYAYWKTALPSDGDNLSDADTRLGIVRMVVDQYREAALAAVKAEYPALRKELERHDAEKREARTRRDIMRTDALRKLGDSAVP